MVVLLLVLLLVIFCSRLFDGCYGVAFVVVELSVAGVVEVLDASFAVILGTDYVLSMRALTLLYFNSLLELVLFTTLMLV